jgi:hypothetical protein
MAIAAPAHGAPDDLVARPLVLDEHVVELRLTAELGVQREAFARPLSFAPDAWWGATSHWTLGLIHSSASLDQIDAGATLCTRKTLVSSCTRPYHGSGIDVRFSALEGDLAIAPRMRLLVRDIDPFKPAVTLGTQVRWAHGRFAITSDPFVRLPLANHDLGNRASLSIPLWLAVQPAAGWRVALHTGFDADFVVLRDGHHSPLGLGVTARVTGEIELGVEAGWQRLYGPAYDAKHGAILVSAGWRR